MSDIVKSLRQASLNQGDYRWEAADEIERLRAALNILQAAMTVKRPVPMAFKKAIIDARAALEGK